MRGLACALALPLCACSFVFDDERPDVPLVGTAPDMTRLPRLNRARASSFAVVAGSDQAYWVAIVEKPSTLRIVRLSEPFREEEIDASGTLDILWRAFYILDVDPKMTRPTKLIITSAGDVGGGTRFDLPPGPPYMVYGGSDDLFAYWPKRKETASFTIYDRFRRDFQRTIAVPPGIDPAAPPDGTLFFAGRYVVTRDGTGRLVAHLLEEERSFDLGVRPKGPIGLEYDRQVRSFVASGPAVDALPRRLRLDLDFSNLITCGKDGLRRVPLDGSPERVLDGSPCEPDVFWFVDLDMLYRVSRDDGVREVRRVPRDGSGPPLTVAGPEVTRVLDIRDDGSLVYSTDPVSRYIYGAGDGWIGEWRFMERGLAPRISRDGARMRWLEHAAQTGAVGDLLSSAIPVAGQAAPPGPIRLARNVHNYGELADGRVLAVANRSFVGAHNRVIVIDEESRTARWVADSTRGYQTIPFSTDILADVVTGATGRDVVRVPIPAKDPSAPP